MKFLLCLSVFLPLSITALAQAPADTPAQAPAQTPAQPAPPPMHHRMHPGGSPKGGQHMQEMKDQVAKMRATL